MLDLKSKIKDILSDVSNGFFCCYLAINFITFYELFSITLMKSRVEPVGRSRLMLQFCPGLKSDLAIIWLMLKIANG